MKGSGKRAQQLGTEELAPLFVHPATPGRLWVVAVLIALPAIAIVAVGLLRGSLPAGAGLAGIVVLPALAYGIGNLVLMERSKGVEFCGSCHETMGPIVESVFEDNGSLASTHFRGGTVPNSEGCYICHSGYGIWGDFGAKTAGLRHMLNTVTGGFEFPLELRGPFDINACLNCHAETASFRAVEFHQNADIQRALLSREMGCTGACHPPAHPAQALNGAGAQ